MLGRGLLAVLPLIGTGKTCSSLQVRASSSRKHSIALAQSASNYIDPVNGFQFTGITDAETEVTYGVTFPPLATSGAQSTEFIGEVVAPIDAKWIGIALGGAMLQDLLLVAWPNAGSIVS